MSKLMNRIKGVSQASPEKRYKNFISTAAAREEVWLLENEDGYATWDDARGTIRLIVYPTQEDAEMFAENDKPVSIEIKSFLHRCVDQLEDTEIGFLVYPNGTDGYAVSTDQMIKHLVDSLMQYAR